MALQQAVPAVELAYLPKNNNVCIAMSRDTGWGLHMGAVSLIDWSFLEAFFGEYGKIITAVLALLVVVISLIVAILKYLSARIAKKERDEANARLEGELHKAREQQRELDEKSAELVRKTAALSLIAAVQHDQETALKEREQKLNDVRAAFVGQEHDLWCLHPARPPGGYQYYDAKMTQRRRQKPIILVANLKGGVGKSTLVANLAAYFKEIGKRVLIIDGDYQGSLSNMLLAADGFDEVSSQINNLLEVGSGFASFESARYVFERRLSGSLIVASAYALAAMENRLMIEHLLGDDKQYDDGRYRLANLLLSEDVEDVFDIALIDAPPRLTAATINGFCVSTHLLIPTVYDKMSAEAVGTFLHSVQTLKNSLNHHIDLLGVVGMLTHQQGQLNTREENAKKAAMKQISQVWGPNYHFFDRHIPRREAIAKVAGDDIAYYCDEEVRKWFEQLGGEISSRLWPIAPPEPPRPPRDGRTTHVRAAEPASPAG